MDANKQMTRIFAALLALCMVFSMIPVHAFAAKADATLTASLNEAKSYINGITINNSSNDPATVVQNFKTHFTWDNEKRENSKSYLFDWSYYNGVVFEGIEYVYEVTGESVYKDYVVEYMSSLISASGGWATCSNNSSKQCAGYNATHGADCYKTASLLLDTYEMTGDSRYLTMAKTLYADLDSAAKSYSLKNAGSNYRHTWATDPSPDLWLDGLYMILPFRAEYAKYIGDQEELDLIVARMQWVSDNMYNSSKGLFYHAADSASSNSGTYWLRSIGWYAAAIVDIMDSMEGDNLEAMKKQLVKLVDGMKACQNASNGMWLNNMNASKSSSNPYETSGTALTCYAVMKAVNNGWLDESYADMAILAFNGICSEKLSGSNLTDICFKGAPGSSNSTFYDNEGKGVGPFIMLYAEILEYVNSEEETPEETEPEATEPEATEPEETEPEETEPEEEETVYSGTGNLEGNAVYTLDSDGINSGEKYLIVYNGRALQNNNGVDANPSVSVSNNQITLADDSTYAWTITQSGSNYYVENNGSYLNLTASGNDPIGSSVTVSITRSGSTYKFRNTSNSGAYLRYSSSQLFCAGTNTSSNGMSLYRRTTAAGSDVVFTIIPSAQNLQSGNSLTLNAAVTVDGASVNLNNCTIAWNSSDSSIAAVSGGTVIGIAGGSASITATLSAVNGTALVEDIVLTIPVTVQGHNYKSVVTAPTCTAQGYTTHTCTICGNSYVDSYTGALGHSYTSVTTPATCTEGGSITYTCTNCGDTYSEVIQAAGHDYAAVVTAPTCTAQGYTTYTCTNCGDSYVSDYTTVTDHTYTSVTTPATCTENGSITYTCDCGDTYSEVIEATGHAYSAVVTAPTCTEGGYTTYTCTCGDSYVADEVDVLDHTYKTVTVEPTCTEYGSFTHTCTACGDSFMEVIEFNGHSYSCTEANGALVYTCASCGDSYTVAQASSWIAQDHLYVLDTDGIEIGEEYKYLVVGANHDYAMTLKGSSVGASAVNVENNIISLDDASGYAFYFLDNFDEIDSYLLTQDGTNTVYHSSGNMYYGNDSKGYWYFGSSIRGAYQVYDYDNQDWFLNYGYAWADETVNAFSVSSNIRYVRLFRNADAFARLSGQLDQNITDADGATVASVLENVSIETSSDGTRINETISVTANMVTWDTEFDGTTPGTYTATVVFNGMEIGTITVNVVSEHVYETVVTAPTCTEAGYTTRTCTICGTSFVSDHTEALGHSYVGVESSNHMVYTCSTCGDSYTEIVVDYARSTSLSSGKKHVITLYSSGKYYALSHANNQISLVQITVANRKITSEVTEDMLWTYSGNKLSYVSDGTTYYLYGSSSWGGWWGSNNKPAISSTNSSTVSFSSSKLKIGSQYLRYSSGSAILYSYATTTYLFVEN